MEKKLDTMTQIIDQKEKDIAASELMHLNAEGRYLAEGKRFTFDVVAIPNDPLR